MSDLAAVDSLIVDVITDNVSDTYASKPAFAVSEMANILKAGAGEISGVDAAGGQSRLRPAPQDEDRRQAAHVAVRHRYRGSGLHSQLPQHGDRSGRGRGDCHHPRPLGSHGRPPRGARRHRQAPRPGQRDGQRQSRHVQRARRAAAGRHDLPGRPRPHARPDGGPGRAGCQRRPGRAPVLDGHFYYSGEIPRGQRLRDWAARTISAARTIPRSGGPTRSVDGRARLLDRERARTRPRRVQRLLALPASSTSAPRRSDCSPTSRSTPSWAACISVA